MPWTTNARPLEIIEAFCGRLPELDLRKTFTSTREARHYLEENPVDLLFLDINMPAESGMSFFRSLSQDCLVIFTTAYAAYAVESYELRAIDYLLKPYTFERFREAVQKATNQLKYQQQSGDPQSQYLLFRVDYSLVRVTTADIQYIEGLDNYLKIHLPDQKPLVVRLTMKAILEQLPAEGFARGTPLLHRGPGQNPVRAQQNNHNRQRGDSPGKHLRERLFPTVSGLSNPLSWQERGQGGEVKTLL